MTAIQWLLFVALPASIAALGVLSAELFRWSQRADVDSERKLARALAKAAERKAQTDQEPAKSLEEESVWIYPTPEELEVFHRINDRWLKMAEEIRRFHGGTSVKTLREMYGSGFAKGVSAKAKLRDVVHQLDDESLSKLVRDYESVERQEDVSSNRTVPLGH